MKSISRPTLAILSLAFIVMLAADVMAQGDQPFRQRRLDREAAEPGQWRMQALAQRLDLSEEQQTAIAELQTAARKQRLELRKQIVRLRHELQGEMLKDKPDERAVVQLTERIGKLKTDLRVVRVKTRLAVRAQLTAEQRDQMISEGGCERFGGDSWGQRPGPRSGGPRDHSWRQQRGPRPGVDKF